jgi:hypothetical protein
MKLSWRCRRHAAIALAVLGLAAGTTVATADMAQARGVEGDEVCESGEFCLYQDRGLDSAVASFSNSHPDYTGYYFPRNRTGLRQPVKNNAAYARNRATVSSALIFSHENYSGIWQCVPPNSTRTLSRGQNASHLFGVTGCAFR